MPVGKKALATGALALSAALAFAPSADAFWGYRGQAQGYWRPTVGLHGAAPPVYFGGPPIVYYGGTGVTIGTGYRARFGPPEFGPSFGMPAYGP